jgi:LAO/AO transport system kinase
MAELKFAAHLQYTGPTAPRDVDWEVPVLSGEAQNNVGVAELLEVIDGHRAALTAAGALEARRRRRRHDEFKRLLVEEFTDTVERRLEGGDLAATFEDVVEGRLDPYSAARTVLAMLSWEPS